MSRTVTYEDFDLLVAPSGSGSYVARVVSSPSGEARHEFDLDGIRPLLDVLKADPGLTEEAARAAGGALYRTVFGGSVDSTFSASRRLAGERNSGLRIRLRLSESPELALIPWEYLYREEEQRFLSLFVDTPVVRYVDLASPIEPLSVEPPLRVLVMMPSGVASDGLDPETEWQLLTEATSQLVDAKNLELVRLDDATYAGLQHALQEGPFHVFHFVGHGGLDDKGGFLVFDDPQTEYRKVSGSDLGPLIADHDAMRLVVLNACEGASSSSDKFDGIAQTLMVNGIPAVAAMQAKITDESALGFAREFYSAVCRGMPIDAALTEARKAISGRSSGGIEWGTPALYMRAVDGRVFAVDRPLDTPSRGLDEDDWDILLRRLKRERVTPIIGWRTTDGILPPQQKIADDWAKQYEYPIDDSGDLTKVAQYMAVTRDRMLPREEIAALCSKATLGDGGDTYEALAALPVPVFLTTNFDDLLTQALRNAGKTPSIEVCPWRNPPADPTSLPPGVSTEPTADAPIVYHLHGHPSDESSMLLTEDDYFDYVVSVSRNRNVIRPRILEALSGTSLVMIGYALEDWMFRVLVRGLIAATEGSARGFSVAVQLGGEEPDDDGFVADYIRALFKASDQNKLSLYWGTAGQFAVDLRQRMEAAPE